MAGSRERHGHSTELEEAAALGAFRVVGAAGDRVIAVKPVRGAKVLKDLLREYFAGCRLVVIRGELDVPELSVVESGYRVRFEDGTEKDLSAEALAKVLRKRKMRKTADGGSEAPFESE